MTNGVIAPEPVCRGSQTGEHNVQQRGIAPRRLLARQGSARGTQGVAVGGHPAVRSGLLVPAVRPPRFGLAGDHHRPAGHRQGAGSPVDLGARAVVGVRPQGIGTRRDSGGGQSRGVVRRAEGRVRAGNAQAHRLVLGMGVGASRRCRGHRDHPLRVREPAVDGELHGSRVLASGGLLDLGRAEPRVAGGPGELPRARAGATPPARARRWWPGPSSWARSRHRT
jgi:hypothetical protein